MRLFLFPLLFLPLLASCQQAPSGQELSHAPSAILADSLPATPRPAAEFIDRYLPMLRGKSVGLVVNQSSLVGSTHLVDTLLSLGVNIRKIFAPEHGIRGIADAGETVKDDVDIRTGLPIISLYGKNKKPTPNQLSGLEMIVFDVQDVGARFYTYISTMHYVMEACAEQRIPFMVLDRPNPNGDYVDGPVLDTASFRSFVGMHPIPVVHGLTVGELADMINGEKWLAGGVQCSLTIFLCDNYTHQTPYSLLVEPSPNLPNDQAIALYPSLCFFEPTIVSVGRGTDAPFQQIGSPMHATHYAFSFVPQSVQGAKSPKHLGKTCYGNDLRSWEMPSPRQLSLHELLTFYQQTENKADFFTSASFFDLLAGTDALRKQIVAQKSEEEIRLSWQEGLLRYKNLRKRYLLYQE